MTIADPVGSGARAASMMDVARLAGVSAQTVSRVSNRSDSVTPATRERVLAAMDQLDYRPNSAARALKSGRFRSIGVLTFSLEAVGNIRTLDAISVEAARRGYSIDLISLRDPTTGNISTALSGLDEHAVDGIIVVLERHQEFEDAITFPSRTPLVVVDSEAREHRASVNADQRQGAGLAVDHLLGLGHRSIRHVAGPEESYSASLREAAWRDTMTAAGLPAPTPIRGDWTAASGYEAGRRLLADPAATAVFAANDQMALGVMHALLAADHRAPDRLSVVGFDDSPESAHFWPPLTTVRQDFAGVGAMALTLLVDAMDGHPVEPGVRMLATELVVRASTGPVRRA